MVVQHYRKSRFLFMLCHKSSVFENYKKQDEIWCMCLRICIFFAKVYAILPSEQILPLGLILALGEILTLGNSALWPIFVRIAQIAKFLISSIRKNYSAASVSPILPFRRRSLMKGCPLRITDNAIFLFMLGQLRNVLKIRNINAKI